MAVGTVSDWSMFLAMAAAGPRSVLTSAPSDGFTGAALAACCGEGLAAGAFGDVGTWPLVAPVRGAAAVAVPVDPALDDAVPDAVAPRVAAAPAAVFSVAWPGL
ncbi:hypothetical protein GCM10023222_50840 [Saccharopolyspora cebuensis]